MPNPLYINLQTVFCISKSYTTSVQVVASKPKSAFTSTYLSMVNSWVKGFFDMQCNLKHLLFVVIYKPWWIHSKQKKQCEQKSRKLSSTSTFTDLLIGKCSQLGNIYKNMLIQKQFAYVDIPKS